MGITVREDSDALQGGFAVIDLGCKVNSPVRLSFRRLDIEPRNLGPAGWQAGQFWWSPEPVDNDGPETVVRVGPDVADEIGELVPIEISLEGHGVIGVVRWPFIMRSARGPSCARIRSGPSQQPLSPRAFVPKARPEQVEEARITEAMQQREETNPNSDRVLPVSLPEAEAKPSPEIKRETSSGHRSYYAYAPSIIAFVTALLFGAFLLFGGGSPPPPNSVAAATPPSPSPTLALQEPSASIKPEISISPGEYRTPLRFVSEYGASVSSDTRALKVLSNETRVRWRVIDVPNWLRVEPREGVLEKNSSTELVVGLTDKVETLWRANYQGAIRIIAEGGNDLFAWVDLSHSGPPPPPPTLLLRGSSGTVVFEERERGDPDPSNSRTIYLAAGSQKLSWVLAKAPEWLQVVPRGGGLEPNGSVSVAVSTNRKATQFSPGEYNAELYFTASGGNTIIQKFQLVVRPFPKRADDCRTSIRPSEWMPCRQ